MTDPQQLLQVVVEIAQEAATLVAERGRGTVQVAATKSSRVDVVTATDTESEELIRSRIAAARPGDLVLGEEGGEAVVGQQPANGGRLRWIVDPIDGTVNFLYGNPHHAVSIAVADERGPLVGVVVQVPTLTTYAAVRGGGATRDGAAIRVRADASLAESLILTGFGYDAEIRARQGQAVAALLPEIRDIRRMGSAALDLCYVAEGSADGYLEEGINEWDYAAGALIVAEAGGRAELCAGPTGRQVMVAAGAKGFGQLLEAAKRAGFVSAEDSAE